MTQSKYWCFRLSNPTEDQINDLKTNDTWSYIIFGYEQTNAQGEETTPHLQGYVEFESRARMATVKNRLENQSLWLGISRGSALENKIYCIKEDQDYFESGDPKNNRLDLVEMIKEGATDKDLFECHPQQFIRYGSGIKNAKKLYLPDRNWIMDIDIYLGPSGTGKTVMAWTLPEKLQMSMFEVNLQSNFPMDGYDGEEIILLDEFRSQIPFGFLLKLMDSKPLKLNVKYGFTKIQAKMLVITSNKEPHQWYPKIEDKSMLYRRINEWACIYRFAPNQEPVSDLSQIGDYSFSRNPTPPLVNYRSMINLEEPFTPPTPPPVNNFEFGERPTEIEVIQNIPPMDDFDTDQEMSDDDEDHLEHLGNFPS